MSDKYYTPTIEEFHIGFEFEVLVYSEKEWAKSIYSYPNDAVFCKDSEGNIWTNESIRVKCLDREDIESLGWEERSKNYYIKKLPPSYPYHLYAVLDFRWGFYDISIDVIRSYEYRDHDDDQRIFRGVIKNKSELIKLLNQLNIKQ